jgi:hypothetical protein
MVVRVRVLDAVVSPIELKESDNRFTPSTFIEAVEESFGKVDFDPCWHPACAVRPSAYLDVRRGDDGLRDDWRGDVVFVNPPWSKQKRWVERAHDQWSRGNVGTVICLVPAKTDTPFFQDVLSRDADVYFIRGRPHFTKNDGTSEPTMVSTMVVIFGASADQRTRFAERVRGRWWLQDRASGKPPIIMNYSLPSCEEAYPDHCHPQVCCVAGP